MRTPRIVIKRNGKIKKKKCYFNKKKNKVYGIHMESYNLKEVAKPGTERGIKDVNEITNIPICDNYIRFF